MKKQKRKTRTIEIEFRARFDERKYKELEQFLKAHAEDCGEDDRDAYFFLLPDKMLKVAHDVMRREARIVVKLNKLGRGSDFEEIELPIAEEHFERAAELLRALGFNAMRSYQRRHNYRHKGVELALKYSDNWGYHLELEIVITNPKQKIAAERKIRGVAAELEVRLMTEKELKEFTKTAENRHQKGYQKKIGEDELTQKKLLVYKRLDSIFENNIHTGGRHAILFFSPRGLRGTLWKNPRSCNGTKESGQGDGRKHAPRSGNVP